MYEDAASADKSRYDAEVAAVLASGGTIATAAKPAANVDAGFPISTMRKCYCAVNVPVCIQDYFMNCVGRVRKICKTDPEVKIISKDAVTVMSTLAV